MRWRADFTSAEVDALHTEAFVAPSPREGGRDRVALTRAHSLGWATARQHAARAGCRWLHVDFTPDLAAFYLDACSFRASQAGLLPLTADVADLPGHDRALHQGVGGGLGDRALRALAERVVAVAGVVGVTLGGSRARGEHHAGSDVDLGVYYRRGLDLAALGALARDVAGPGAEVTAPGGWGPWVDGGGWLDVGGVAVDWIYRDVDRVRVSWAAAQRGQVDFHAQVGHPLGVPGFAYAGEIALARVLADPTGELGALHRQASAYPPALGGALVQRLWEADFLLAGAAKVIARADAAYVAGCLFRVVGLCAHALHAHAGRWLINEKGAIASAGRLPGAPSGFSRRAHHLLGHLGTTPAQLRASLQGVAALVADVRAATTPEGRSPQTP